MRLALTALFTAFTTIAQAAPMEKPDPYIWLEDFSGPRVMDWVKAENARSLGVLTADPRFKIFHDQALALAEAHDRIPAPALLAGAVYNFWQDDTHVRGIWRRTTLQDYRNATPHWTTVLDLDALAKAEHANWVWKGADCLEPSETRCLISLSDGGEDAITLREFDLTTNGFVPGGFTIPRAKTRVDWQDKDTLIVATDWGTPDSMSHSGYPVIAKRLRRGQKLADAVLVAKAPQDHVWMELSALSDGAGNHAFVLSDGLDFFRNRHLLLTATGTQALPIPDKAELAGLVDHLLVVKSNEVWKLPDGKTLPAGCIATLDLAHPAVPPVLVFAPGPRQSVEEVAVTQHHIVAAINDNVRGHVLVFTHDGGIWNSRKLALPDNVAAGIVSSESRSDTIFVAVAGFLQPSSVWQADASSGKIEKVKQSPARFDAAGMSVDQFEATSTDGTKIPYFVVHKTAMKLDGSNPTLLNAYGGFQISMTPTYSPVLGKLWLEHGGVYVLANIRGGGEFGPAWHEAALKTNRQKAWDDFTSVGRDLISRKITSPRRLGILGGSNGGLLMGVQFTQHPELWNAVVIDVPLLDMLRFEKIAAGASWVAEYGSVSIPAQKAFLEKTSPYNNLRAGVKYPEALIYTTTKDDRVGPQHARKFAARLQELKVPYLYYEAIEGGHSAGANAKEVSQEKAIEFTYLTRKLMD
jgi:prolyl oligopeptidase